MDNYFTVFIGWVFQCPWSMFNPVLYLCTDGTRGQGRSSMCVRITRVEIKLK